MELELLLLMLAPAIAAWALVYLRFAGLWGYLLASLIAGTIFGHAFFHVSVVTSDRLLLGFAIVVFVIWYLQGKCHPKAINSGDILLGALATALTLTTFVRSADADASIAEGMSKLLFFFLLPIGFYLLASRAKLSAGHVQWILIAFVSLGLYLSVTAVAEKLDWKWAIFPRYISNASYTEFLGRGRGPLLNPSGNGILMALALSSSIALLMRHVSWKRSLSLLAMPVLLAGIASTMTRCAWLGGLATLVVCGLAMTPQKWRPYAIGAILSCCIAGVTVGSSSLASFKRDKDVSVEQMRQSAELRPILATVAWKMFQDRPLLGCGTGQYMSVSKNYLFDRNINLPLEKARPYVQHNIFLALLTENGLLGMVPFAVLLLLWSLWSWWLWHAPQLPIEHRQIAIVFAGTLVAYLCNGLFQDVLIIPMINSYLFFLAGCLRNSVAYLPQPATRQAVIRSVPTADALKLGSR